jgi:hypothetical protein
VLTLIRYVRFQIPGWIIAAIGLTALWYWEILLHWTAVICFSGWVLKDFVLYPLVRSGYETKAKTGLQALVGARGMAEDDLVPEGYVRVRVNSGTLLPANLSGGSLAAAASRLWVPRE